MKLLRAHLVVLLLSACSSVPILAQSASDSLRQLYLHLDALAAELEQLKHGGAVTHSYTPRHGIGPAASRVYSLTSPGVTIAGYGEAVYENYAATSDNGTASSTLDKVDFLRAIVYVGYRFNDWILFNSEIEVEHASTGKGGEVSLELGYIDLMLSRPLNIRAGMLLPPVGIINEKHEPTTFLGTLRPQTERFIIPSTWRTLGVGVYGEVSEGLLYRAYLVEGLNAAKFSPANGIRDGRQSGAGAIAEDFALTGTLEYLGVPGATFGADFYAGNSGQGMKDSLGTVSAMTTLYAVHAEYAWKGMVLRGLVTGVSLDEAGRVSEYIRKKSASPSTPVAIGSSMGGWLLLAGYDVMPALVPGTSQQLTPFVQYERLNTQQTVAAGFAAGSANNRSTLTLGVRYAPHPQVALKLDYRDNKNSAGTGLNQWNAAVGYMF